MIKIKKSKIILLIFLLFSLICYGVFTESNAESYNGIPTIIYIIPSLTLIGPLITLFLNIKNNKKAYIMFIFSQILITILGLIVWFNRYPYQFYPWGIYLIIAYTFFIVIFLLLSKIFIKHKIFNL